MKWNAKKQKTKLPNLFMETYHPKQANVITPENYLLFLI